MTETSASPEKTDQFSDHPQQSEQQGSLHEENGPGGPRSDRIELASVIISAIGTIATAAGVIVAVCVYVGSLQQERVAASLNFALQYF